jgi:hypothetical protein
MVVAAPLIRVWLDGLQSSGSEIPLVQDDDGTGVLLLERRLDRLQPERLEEDVPQRERIRGRSVDAAPEFQLAELEGKVPEAARQNFHQPVAERLLLRQHALEPPLPLDPRADDRGHAIVRDLGGPAAVAHVERGQEKVRELRRRVRAELADGAQEAVDRDPKRVRQAVGERAIAVLWSQV